MAIGRDMLPRERRRLLWIGGIGVGALMVAALLLIVVNAVVVPRIVSRLGDRISAQSLYTLEVRRSGYLPFRGVVLRDVVLESRGARRVVPGLRLSRLRIHGVLRPARTLLRSASGLSLPNVEAESAASDVIALARYLAEAGLAPRSLSARDVELRLGYGGDRGVALSSDSVTMRHDRRDRSIAIRSTGARPSAVSGSVIVDYGREILTADAAVTSLPLAMEPFMDGSLNLELAIGWTAESQLDIRGAGQVINAELLAPLYADDPIHVSGLGYEFTARLDPHAITTVERTEHTEGDYGYDVEPTAARGSLVVNRGDLRVEGVALTVEPSLTGLFAGPQTLRVSVQLAETLVQDLMDAIPPAVSGELARARISGTLAWELDLQVPLDSVSDMEWNGETELSGFAVREIPAAANVYKLNDAFVHTIVDREVGFVRTVAIPAAQPASMDWMLLHSEHTERQIRRMRAEQEALARERPPVTVVADDSPGDSPAAAADPAYRYVRVDDLSPWIVRAVLTAEDGDFFFYGGVNPVTLADAIESNLAAGEIVYGASTISMQLVKMLFLDQERIFSRKLQEVFLVYLMEHHVPVAKGRILELYLNLAEFGPGIFGIYDAADHYFAKHPGDLSAGEATWLASILPSPKSYYRYYEEGRISNAWFARMVSLYDIMLERGRMTQEEYDIAIRQRPEFASQP